MQSGFRRKEAQKSGFAGKFLNVTSVDLSNLQNILHSEKGSLGNTYKTNAEANAEVHDLNQKTMNALGTLAFLFSTFEKAELFDNDVVIMQEATMRANVAQRSAETAQEQVYHRRDEYHRRSAEYKAAEEYLNVEVGCIRVLVRDTAAATLTNLRYERQGL